MSDLPDDTAAFTNLGSLDEVAALVESERQAQRRSFDSLDTKAGIVIGFAAATSALAERGGPLLLPGVIAAAVAAIVAVLAFLPREFQVLNPTWLQRRYLGRPEDLTRFDLITQKASRMEANARLLRAKARRLTAALWLLAAAVILIVAGTPDREPHHARRHPVTDTTHRDRSTDTDTDSDSTATRLPYEPVYDPNAVGADRVQPPPRGRELAALEDPRIPRPAVTPDHRALSFGAQSRPPTAGVP